MKIIDLQGTALAPERGTHSLSIVGKDSTAAIASTRALLFDDRKGAIARNVEHRNALAIRALSPWILAIPDKEYLFVRVKIRPFDSTDLVLAHCRRNGKADDPSNWNLLKAICVESSYQPIASSSCVPFPTSPSRASAMRAKAMGSTERITP